jgi:NAD(P)-dependent dehydrogenase (short-subunit alcohol dehydrogenase family)
LAAELAGAGWTVIIDGRDIDVVLVTAAQLGPNVIPVPGDVTDATHRDQLIAAAVRTGGLDLLVNNASTLGPSPLPSLADFPVAAIGDVFRTNAGAPLALIQVALPLLARSLHPSIVNITSDAAREAYAGWGLYGASKAALEQLGRVLAVEEPGVRVWSFDPGDMRTQMHQDAFPGEDISDRPLPDEVAVPSFLRMLRDRPDSGFVRAASLAEVA